MNDLFKKLRLMSMAESIGYYTKLEEYGRENGTLHEAVRILCLADLFYLLVCVCKRDDMLNEFAYARCREVQSNPDNMLDLWSREHFKSSIITFGLTIQDILKNPEITFGIFSHTRPIAKAFLRQIMREFEDNETLHAAFPDILWGKDIKQAPKWSEDDGLIVKRKSNPKEATIEAWGLIDGQPTSKHYGILLYDDIVVQASVSTPEMIQKTMTALEQSYNLGISMKLCRRFVGTRWHFNDAYKTIKDRGTAVSREHPGRIGGTEDGKSVFWSEEIHLQKRRDMGPYTYAAQILLNPKADALQGFKRDWLRYYSTINPGGMIKYVLVDAANSKKRGSDYTSMWVIGLASDGNYYALDMIRDRLNLTERAERLFTLHRKWKPKQVRYEKYGMMADIEHIKSRQESETYRFDIIEVAGQTSKADRIKRLLPIFEGGRFYLPKSAYVTDWQKITVDLVNAFVEEEYMAFPVGLHDDMCFPSDAPVVTRDGIKPIVEVTTDDYVLTRNGFRRVLKAWCRGNKEVITRFGITATPNHRIFTENKGWVRLDSLASNDIILECQPIKDTSCEKQLSLTDESITDTPMPNNLVTECTTAATTNGKQTQEGSMGTFGNFITEKSLPDITSITLTEIATITTSQTLPAYQVQHTKWNIVKKEAREQNHQNISPISKISETSQKNGTHQMKEESGTGSTHCDQSLKIGQKNHASSAERHSSQKLKKHQCAAQNVKTNADGDCSENNIPVYDLTVEDDHEFFVYGILAHNCDALSRIAEPDLPLVWPMEKKIEIDTQSTYDIPNKVAWMA